MGLEFKDIFALLGWILALTQLILVSLERRRTSNNDFLLRAVDYFTGGTQKRSVGISLIEGVIKEKKDYSNVLIPLLTNQLVYLLLQADSDKNRAHEERNVIRIFNLLEELMLNSTSEETHFHNVEVIEAISRRLDGETSSVAIAKQTLELRKEKFVSMLNAS